MAFKASVWIARHGMHSSITEDAPITVSRAHDEVNRRMRNHRAAFISPPEAQARRAWFAYHRVETPPEEKERLAAKHKAAFARFKAEGRITTSRTG